MARGSEGWIKLHRKLKDNPVYTQCAPAVLKAWIHCMLEAERQPIPWFDGLRQVELPSGSFATSLADFGSSTGLTIKQVRGALANLQKLGIIEFRANCGAHGGTAVTICNWSTYQSNEERQGRLEGTMRASTFAPPPGCKEVFLNPPPPLKPGETGRKNARVREAADENGNGDAALAEACKVQVWDQYPGVKTEDDFRTVLSLCGSMEKLHCMAASLAGWIASGRWTELRYVPRMHTWLCGDSKGHGPECWTIPPKIPPERSYGSSEDEAMRRAVANLPKLGL